MDEYTGRVPPRVLLASFMLISAGYLACRLSELIVFFGTARLLWPKTWAIYFARKLTPDDILANAEIVYPTPLVWTSVVAATLVAWLVGAMVFRRAPFGPLGHAVFLALILFVTFLQQSMQLPPLFKWMPLVKMAVYPLAVLFGARWAEQHQTRESTVDDQE